MGGALDALAIGFGHTFFGFMAAAAEAVGGLCLAAGFLFRPAALLIAATMFVAVAREVASGDNFAHSFKNFWVASGLAFIGSGRYSLDHWLRARREPRIELPREAG